MMKFFQPQPKTRNDFQHTIKMLPDYYEYRIWYAWYPVRRYVAVGSAILESGWYFKTKVLEVRLKTGELHRWSEYANKWRAFEAYNDDYSAKTL